MKIIKLILAFGLSSTLPLQTNHLSHRSSRPSRNLLLCCITSCSHLSSLLPFWVLCSCHATETHAWCSVNLNSSIWRTLSISDVNSDSSLTPGFSLLPTSGQLRMMHSVSHSLVMSSVSVFLSNYYELQGLRTISIIAFAPTHVQRIYYLFSELNGTKNARLLFRIFYAFESEIRSCIA